MPDKYSAPKISTDTVIPYFSASNNLYKDLKLDSIYKGSSLELHPAQLDTLYHYWYKTNGDSIAALFSAQYIPESGGNPSAKQKDDKGRELESENAGVGALQYSDSIRKKKMSEYKSPNYPNSELLRQAEFTNLEFNENPDVMPQGQIKQFLNVLIPETNGLRTITEFYNSNNLKDKGKYLTMGFVRPKESDIKGDRRGTLAEVIHDEFIPKMKEKLNNVPYRYTTLYTYKSPFDWIKTSFKLGGKFTPKKSKLVKNAEEQNSKRDMRKKFIKSDRPTYTNNRVKKNQSGGVLSVDPSIFVSWNNISTSNIKLPEVDYTPKSNLDRFLERTENSASINLLGNPKEQEEKQDQKEIPVSKEEPIVKKTPLANPSKGNDAFNKIYDELISEMPDAAEYRDFLTTVAKYESGFDSRAKNKYAPAWGYFQFMQDDNKYNNIKSYAGVDTQTFLNNPKLQIRAAINLAKAMEKGFTKEDIEAAKSKGISRWGMLGGAWLGGNGGLRKYLLQNINSSDKHWNPEGKGIDMENQIRRYNF